MSLTIRQRVGFELLQSTLALARNAAKVLLAALEQAEDYTAHVRHGGDPNERRRNKWIKPGKKATS